jgi:hypothetical protein
MKRVHENGPRKKQKLRAGERGSDNAQWGESDWMSQQLHAPLPPPPTGATGGKKQGGGQRAKVTAKMDATRYPDDDVGLGGNAHASTLTPATSTTTTAPTSHCSHPGWNVTAAPRVQWWEGAGPEHATAADRGRALLSNLLRCPADTFEADYWCQKPWISVLTTEERVAMRATPGHPAVQMLTMQDIDDLLRRSTPRAARFLKDVDVTKFVGRERMSFGDGEEPVDADAVWNAFKTGGFSVRLVHPQQWSDPLYELCAYLQEYFGSTVGCSSYLTPAGTQGFAPHYDDVEIFVVQLEGRKRWRLYNRPDASTSPRTTAVTEWTVDQLGPPTADFWLAAGDVMYFPRGTVHQAVTSSEEHSLHLTFSTYQRHTWFDLLARMPLGTATRRKLAHVETVEGWHHLDLPCDLLHVTKVEEEEEEGEERRSRCALWAGAAAAQGAPDWMVHAMADPALVTAAIDGYAAEFFLNSLPAVPSLFAGVSSVRYSSSSSFLFSC